MEVDDEDYVYDASDGEYSETQMSLDGSSDGEFSETLMDHPDLSRTDVQMRINTVVDENGWSVSTPAHSVVAENLNVDDAHPQIISNNTGTGSYSATSMTASVQNAGVAIDGEPSTAAETTDIQHEDDQTSNVSRYPRSTRFSEMLDRSDGEMLQNLMNALEDQLRSVETNGSADASVITNSANGETSDATVATYRLDSESMSNRPPPMPQPHYSGSSAHPNPATDGPGAPTRRLESSTVRHRYSVNFGSGPSARGVNPQAETVSIPQNDYMHLIRSIEGLTFNVQTLLDQRGSLDGVAPAISINAPPFNMENMRRSLLNSEQEEAQPRIHRRKLMGENQVHDIMRNFLVENRLRISKRQKQLSLKESIPKAVVNEFEAGIHNGPTLQDIRLDWTEPMTSLWNSTAIHVLATHILERIKDNYYPQVNYQGWMTVERFFSELKAKLATSREEYINLVALNAPETDISAAEGRARFAAKKSQKKVRNRRNMRRKTLYNCRLSVICENLGSDPAWENALMLMQVIGDSAMSDDETDNERSTRRKKVVRRVEKHWASASLKSMTNTLDLYYSRFYNDGNQKPGPGPRDRLTTIASDSPRGAPKALPTNCYSAIFLNSLSSYQRSRLRCKRDMIIPVLPLPPA